MRTSTDEILMIRPARFGYNPETAESNAFQKKDGDLDTEEIAALAIQEFDHMVHLLREHGVNVHVFEDSGHPVKPDALFPNNWVSFHPDGQVFTYPMMAPSRRREVRNDILHFALNHWHFTCVRRLDARAWQGQFLEGTGSMILDHPHHIAYACLSPRTEKALLEEWSQITRYQPVSFRAVDAKGLEIYHTNVMMALGDDFAVICLDAIPDPDERALVEQHLHDTGKTIVPITLEQMGKFAGNMLQVLNRDGHRLLVMSEQAFQSLDDTQIAILGSFAQLLPVPLWTIETYGGGSARCMMAEVFLPELRP